MFGNLSGPTLIVTIGALLLIAIIAGIVALIVWITKRAGRAKMSQQAELQRAYNAGLASSRANEAASPPAT